MEAKACTKKAARLARAVVMLPLVLGVVLGLGFGTLILSPASAQTPVIVIPDPTHIYELNGDLKDSLGLGPDMVLPNPAGLGPEGYTFDKDKGPSLSNVLTDRANYSIEMLFFIEDVKGWKKLIDFKNRVSDSGFYSVDGIVNFFGIGSGLGPYATFIPFVPAHMVLTRNGSDNQFIIYVYGVEQINFTDSTGWAIFSGPDNIIHFLRDDTKPYYEDPSGFLDYVRIYDGVLAPDEVQALFEAGNSSPDPPTPLNHFAVYDVKPQAFAGGSGRHGNELNIEKEVTDTLGTSVKTVKKAKRKTVKKAKRILVPLDQNGEETAGALVCYDFQKPKGKKGKKGKDEELGIEVWVSNPLYDEFVDGDGGQNVEIKKLKLICVWSEID